MANVLIKETSHKPFVYLDFEICMYVQEKGERKYAYPYKLLSYNLKITIKLIWYKIYKIWESYYNNI